MKGEFAGDAYLPLRATIPAFAKEGGFAEDGNCTTKGGRAKGGIFSKDGNVTVEGNFSKGGLLCQGGQFHQEAEEGNFAMEGNFAE